MTVHPKNIVSGGVDSPQAASSRPVESGKRQVKSPPSLIPGGGRLASSAGGLIAKRHTAPVAAVDLADSTLRRQIDDHVALAGMQADPGQDLGNPITVAACAALCLISDSADVRRVYLEDVQALANLRLAVFAKSCCFGWRDQQKKQSEREADSEDGVQCETLSRAHQKQNSVQTIEQPPSDVAAN